MDLDARSLQMESDARALIWIGFQGLPVKMDARNPLELVDRGFNGMGC